MRYAIFWAFTVALAGTVRADDLDTPLGTFDDGSITWLDLSLSLEHAPDWIRPRIAYSEYPGFVEAAVRRLAGNRLISRKAFHEAGARDLLGLPEARLAYRQALDELITRHMIDIPSRPTEEEVEDYYRQHSDRWSNPERVTILHVFVQVNDASSETERAAAAATAAAIHEEIIQGASIAEVARRYAHLSEGDYERGAPTEAMVYLLNEPMQRAVNSLQPGEISEPIRTPHGWDIVQLISRARPEPLSFEVAGAAARSDLYEERREAAEEALRRRMDDEAPIMVYRGTSSSGTVPDQQPAYLIAGVTVTHGEFTAERRYLAELQKVDPANISEAAIVRHLQRRIWAEVTGFADLPLVTADIRLAAERTLANAYLAKEVDPFVYAPSPAELREFYERNPQRLRVGEQRSGWMLTIRSGANVSTRPLSKIYFLRKKMMERQRAAQEALEAGLSFEDTVLLYSTEESEIASKGYYPPGEWHGRIFQEISDGLQPGETADWRLQDDACYLVRLEERIPPHLPPFEEIREEVRREWEKQLRIDTRDMLVDLALEEADFEIHPAALRGWDPGLPLPQVQF